VTLTFDDVLSASTLGGKRGKSEGKMGKNSSSAASTLGFARHKPKIHTWLLPS